MDVRESKFSGSYSLGCLGVNIIFFWGDNCWKCYRIFSRNKILELYNNVMAIRWAKYFIAESLLSFDMSHKANKFFVEIYNWGFYRCIEIFIT